MAGEQLPLGIRFTARDVETANITSEVQKAINAAIANTDTKKLSKKFEKAPIAITATLSKKAKNIITKDIQSAVNKVGLTFTDKNVRTKALIDKVRRGVGQALATVSTKTFGTRLYNAAVKVRNGINVALNSAKFSDLSKRLQQQLTKPISVRVGKIEPTKDATIKLQGRVDGKTINESLRALDGKYSILIRAKIQGLREAVSQVQKQIGGAPVTGGAQQIQANAKAQQILAQNRKNSAQAAISHTKATNQEAMSQKGSAKATAINADSMKQFHGALSPATNATNKLSTATVQFADAQKRGAKNTQLMFQPFNKTRAMTDSLAKSFQEAGINAEILGTRIAQIAKRFSGFFIYTAALFKFLEAIRETTQAIKDLDRTSASLGKVLKDLSEEDIDAVNQQLIEMAINTKRAYGEAATAMENFARQGLSTKDAMQATKGVLDLLNISTVDAATASKLIITTFNAFGGEMEEMTKTLATFSDLADASAIDVVDLAQGFIRSAAAAEAFGVSQEQLASAIATVGGVTQMQATRIGTAFKTIFSYLGQNRKAVLELTASYRGINRSVGDLDNEFSTMHDTLRFVADGWASFSKEQRSAIGQLVGGKRRFNELSALMQNFSKYQELYGQSLEESNAIQRKSEVESKTLAAAHRELSSSIVQLSKSFTDFGATDFYKDIVSGLSTIIQTASQALRGLDSISNFIAEASDEEIAVGIDGEAIRADISNAERAFLGFMESATSGSNLLTNSFIYLFAKVVLPFIGRATKSFRAFLTGNQEGLNKILAQQAGYTKEVANSINALGGEQQRLTGILQTEQQILRTRQQSTQAAQGGIAKGTGSAARHPSAAIPMADNRRALEALGRFTQATQAASAAEKNAIAVSKGYRNALTNDTKVVKANIDGMKILEHRRKSLLSEVDRTSNVFKKLYVAVRNGLRIQAAENRAGIAAPKQAFAYTMPIFGKGISESFKKSLKGFSGSIANIRKEMSGMGGQMIKMVAVMQGIQAVGGGFRRLAEGMREEGNKFGANAADLGSTVAETTAPLAAFGPAAALAGVTMGALRHTIEEVNKHMEAQADLARQETKARMENLSASEVLAAAQNNYLLQLELVERGMGKFVENVRTGVKEFKIIATELEDINIRVAETRAVERIKEDMNEVVRQATILSTKWNDNIDKIDRASDMIDIFKSSALDVANTQIDLDLENMREVLGYASSDLGDLIKQINQIGSVDVEFTLPAGGEFGKFIKIGKEAGDVIDRLSTKFNQLRAGEITRDQFAELNETLSVSTPEIERYNAEIEKMRKEQSALQKTVENLSGGFKGAGVEISQFNNLGKNVSNGIKALRDLYKEASDGVDKFLGVQMAFNKAIDEPEGGFIQSFENFVQGGIIEEYKKEFNDVLKSYTEFQSKRGQSTEEARKELATLVREAGKYDEFKAAQKELTDEHKARIKETEKAIKTARDAANLSEEINKHEEKRNEIIEDTKKQQIENLATLAATIKEVDKKVVLANNNLRIQIQENELLRRNDDIIRGINGSLAENGTTISAGLASTIETRKELEKSAIAVRKLSAAREQQIQLIKENLGGDIAVDFGAVEAITQQIDVEIKDKLREQIENMIGALGDRTAQETERIRQLEKERFSIAREQLEKLAEMEKRRSEIAEEMTSALLDSATDMGATDTEVGALLDSSIVANQLESINDEIKNKLNNQAKVQLAYSLEQIGIEEQKQKAILDAQIERANEEEKVALEVKRATIEKNSAEERSIEIMEALKKSSVDAFQTIKSAADAMRGSLENIRNLRNDVLKQNKEIAKLQAQIQYDEQVKGLKAHKEALQDNLDTTNSFANAMAAVERKNNALADALVSSEQYFEDVAESVGGLEDLGETLNMTNMQVELAKKSLGGFATQFANVPQKFGLFEDKIQELRVNSMKETVSRLQEEYNKLQSYGEQLYSADFGQLYKMASAQSAIENATGDLNEKLQKVPAFLRDAAAAYVKRQYGEEGEQAVAKAGLERVGIDSGQLESLEKQTIDAAKEAVKAQFKLVELQQNSINVASVHAEKIQSQISEVDEKIKSVEETRDSVGSMDQTLKEQLRDARERKKFLQKQIAQEAKLYSQNAQKIDRLIPGVDSMTQGIPQQISRLDKIYEVLKGQNIAVELAKVMQPFQQQISDVSTQATGGETVADAGAFTNQMQSIVFAPLNEAIGRHKDNINATNTQIESLREIYNNQSVSAKKMIEQMNKVIAQADTVLSQDIAAATGETIVTLKNDEIFNSFSMALENGMSLSEGTIANQKEATKSAVTEGMKDTNNEMGKVVEATNGVAAANEKLGQFVQDVGNGVAVVGTNVAKITPAVDRVADAVRGMIINIKKVVQGAGGTTTVTSSFAGLNNMEMAGVISAAKREKSKMPGGSSLTVANTSELIMTPKQAKKIFGQVQMPDGVRNVQKHMYGTKRREVIKEKESSSSKDVAKLTNKINDLLDRADKKQLFNNKQDISINVDGKREISLKGVKSFKKELQDTFKKQMAGVSSKAELNAVRGTLENLIRRLRETGVDGV